MELFENYDRRIAGIEAVMKEYGIESLEAARKMCVDKGFDPYEIVKGIQPICFEDACWAYVLGAAIAMKKGMVTAAEAAKATANSRRNCRWPVPMNAQPFPAFPLRDCSTGNTAE